MRKVEVMIRANRRVTIDDVALQLNFSHGTAWRISWAPVPGYGRGLSGGYQLATIPTKNRFRCWLWGSRETLGPVPKCSWRLRWKINKILSGSYLNFYFYCILRLIYIDLPSYISMTKVKCMQCFWQHCTGREVKNCSRSFVTWHHSS